MSMLLLITISTLNLVVNSVVAQTDEPRFTRFITVDNKDKYTQPGSDKSKMENLQRYVVEKNHKPAIVGSALYDPVKRQFVGVKNKKCVGGPTRRSDTVTPSSNATRTNLTNTTLATTTRASTTLVTKLPNVKRRRFDDNKKRFDGYKDFVKNHFIKKPK